MADKIIKEIIAYALIASVYIAGISVTDTPFSVFWYTPVYVMVLIYGVVVFQRIDVKIIYGLVVVISYALLTAQADTSFVVKQLVNIGVSLLVFFCLVRQENYSLDSILRKYIRFSKVILVIGFVQMAFFIAGAESIFLAVFPFLKGTNITFRFQSLAEEPSVFSIAFTPIVFIVLHNLFYGTRFLVSRWWGLLFMAAYLLTLSAICYVGLILILVLLYFKRTTRAKVIYSVAFLLALCVFVVISSRAVPQIGERIGDTLFAFSNDIEDPDVYESVNLSTYAIASNAKVSYETLRDYPIFGRGLGTHELSYEQYLPEPMKAYSRLNSKDASSMALRLLSETGLLGFFLFLMAASYYRIRYDVAFDEHQTLMWIINNAMFVILVVALIRHGNYTSSGKMLFGLMYYYSFRWAGAWRNVAPGEGRISAGAQESLL